MKQSHHSSPHLVGENSVAAMMRKVLLALIPGIGATLWLLGFGVVFNILLAAATTLAAEAIMLKLRGRPVAFFLRDYSALVTGVLLALCLPPLAPWWIPVIGAIAAIVVAKHLYGGLGYNPFNPAMIGYVVLLIAFPVQMTQWIIPPDGVAFPFDTVWRAVFSEILPATPNIDSITAATPLDYIKTQLKNDIGLSDLMAQTDMRQQVHIWQWISFSYLLGGLWLIQQKVISWHIPTAMLLGLFLIATVFSLAQPEHYASPWFHLLSGAGMLGAFFIATDPITAATTVKGRLYYGFGIGVLVYVIRTWGGYPDGIAFAVLLMNMTAPMLDQLTQPRVFGENRRP